MSHQNHNCPYPGLRPFESHESHLFFGRAEAIQELLARLRSFQFLPVVGRSGAGKSSLIRAGLIPALAAGFQVGQPAPGRVILLRPGHSPIQNLARALHSSSQQGKESEAELQETVTNLRRSSFGLSEELIAISKTAGECVVIIDQFEEIFRVLHRGDAEEAHAFVRSLLMVTEAGQVPASVIVTMRADYIGDSTIFYGLPEALNRGQYLLPRLTRSAMEEALVGPAAICRAELEPSLINRVLEEVGTDFDQLSLMQHAMRRVWENAVREGSVATDGTLVLRLVDYEAVGGLRSSLPIHAEEILSELDQESREIARKLFQLACEIEPQGYIARRPVRMREIAEVAQTSAATAAAVVDCFSRKGRNLLLASSPDLTPDTIIEITHEALVRNWERLKLWVEEEHRSAQLYQRLEESARRWREGSESLLSGPQLEIALEWLESLKPTAVWAARYGQHFETTIDFLSQSRAWGDAEELKTKLLETKEKTLADKVNRKAKIFLSYRRSDNPDAAEIIYQSLRNRFGKSAVFYDLHDVPFGEDFESLISKKINECGVLLVVIGRGWLDARHEDGRQDRGRRLDDPLDQVRIEIEIALRVGVQVIPVLVGPRHQGPRADELPPSISQIAKLSFAEVFAGQDFNHRVELLIDRVEGVVGSVNKYLLWLRKLTRLD